MKKKSEGKIDLEHKTPNHFSMNLVGAVAIIVILVLLFTLFNPKSTDNNLAGEGSGIKYQKITSDTEFGRLVARSETKPAQYVARDNLRDAVVESALMSSSVLRSKDLTKIVYFSPSEDNWDSNGGFYATNNVNVAVVDNSFDLNVNEQDTLLLKEAIKNLPNIYRDLKVRVDQSEGEELVVVSYGNTEITFGFGKPGSLIE